MKKLSTILLIFILVMSATNIFAVTYRNDGTSNVILRDKSDNPVILAPEGTLETYYYVDLTKPAYSDITKVTDLPYSKFSLANNSVVATTSGVDVPIHLDANFGVITLITGTIDVYFQHVDNTPPVFSGLTGDMEITKFPLDGTCDNLVITGTGTCQINQYKVKY